MDHNDKRRFIEDLIDSVRDDVLNKLLQNKLPEEWDGMELREYIADRFNESRYMSSTPENRKAFRSRLRDYKNEVIVRNL